MRRSKRIFAILLLLSLLLSPFSGLASAAEEDLAAQYADKLSQIGVFVGTKNGFELEREPTRLEGLIMLVRLLGKETEANKLKNETGPFIDVPDWGSGYTNYAYANGLTNGVDGKRFGTNDKMSAAQYVTLVLRALGYNDRQGDFQYAEALDKAVSIGLLDKAKRDQLAVGKFTRGAVAEISYFALLHNLKDRPLSLAGKLVNDGAIAASDARKIGVLAQEADETGSNDKVTFADPVLEDVVREAIGKQSGDIYSRDVLGLTYLNTEILHDRRIKSLEGIQALHNLTELSLPFNLIEDLRPLTGLSRLQKLNLNNNKIEDLSPLTGLTELEQLAVSENFVRQIEPLSRLTNLISLQIKGNVVTDIAPLAHLSKLQSLGLSDNAISSIEVVRTMASLTSVNVDGNPVADMSPLEETIREGRESVEKIESVGKLARAIIQDTIREGMTDLEKEAALHDYIIDTVEYDTQYFSTNIPTKTSPDDLYGALAEHYAVCGGYARAMTVLGRMAGLDILYITGESSRIGHAWNLIRLDGTYYHVDPTWDDNDNLWGYQKPKDAEEKRIDDIMRRAHYNLSHSQRLYEIRWDIERYPTAKVDAPRTGSVPIQVSINSEIPLNRDVNVWFYLGLSYTDHGVDTGKSVQIAKAVKAGTERMEVTLDVPDDIPLNEGIVKYDLSYEMYEVMPFFEHIKTDFMFTDSGFIFKPAVNPVLNPNGHLYLTFFKIGSKGISFNQAAAQGQNDSYALQGEAFRYAQKAMENTEPLSYVRTVSNVQEVVLPPNSAVYVSEVMHGADFDDKSWNYLYGEKALAVNHGTSPKVYKPGEIVYTLRPFPGVERAADVYFRLSVFDGDFNESEYRTLKENHKVIFDDSWITPQE